MKCPECGAELENGAAFCWSCGHRVGGERVAVRQCSSCGEPLEGDAKFCPMCGARVNAGAYTDELDAELDLEENSEKEEEAEENMEETGTAGKCDTAIDKIKKAFLAAWDGIDGYSKFCVSIFGVLLYCFVLALVSDNGLSLTMVILQMIGLVFLYLIHNKILFKKMSNAYVWGLWGFVVLLNIIYITSFHSA